MIAVIIIHFVSPAFIVDYRFVDAGDSHRGGWKGLSEHKNLFGEYMALAVALLLLVRFKRWDRLRYCFMVLAAISMVASRSANALACTFAVVAAMPLWRHISSRGDRRVQILVTSFIACALVLLAFFAQGNMGALLQLLGRDTTLTGRTEIWRAVVLAIDKRPFLGYGFGAFWDSVQGETLQVWSNIGFVVRGAHSGYLDLCLAYGIVGVPLVFYLFVTGFRKALDYCRSARCQSISLWPVTYLLFFFLYNLTESELMQSWRSLSYLLFATVFTALQLHDRGHVAVLHPVPKVQVNPRSSMAAHLVRGSTSHRGFVRRI